MICFSKLETLFHRIYPALRNFPRSEKFSLSQEIKNTFLHCLRCMSLANSVKSRRKEYLLECEGYLLHLTTLIRLSNKEKYISKGFYEDIDTSLTEIKKMVNSWIKQTMTAKADKPKVASENSVVAI